MEVNSKKNNNEIFTTVAFLKPIKIQNEKGKYYWTWVVSEFIDDSFQNGNIYNPNEYSYSLENLLEDPTRMTLHKSKPI